MISYESIGFSISRAFHWIPKEGLAFRRKFKLKPQPRKLRSEWVGHFTNLKTDKHAFLTKSVGTYKKSLTLVKNLERGGSYTSS